MMCLAGVTFTSTKQPKGLIHNSRSLLWGTGDLDMQAFRNFRHYFFWGLYKGLALNQFDSLFTGDVKVILHKNGVAA